MQPKAGGSAMLASRRPLGHLSRMRRSIATIALGTCLAAFAVLLQAAAARADGAMTFTPGRLDGSPACGGPCAEFIVASGEITHLTSLRYLWARKLTGDRDLPVILESPGGFLIGATATARLWRRLGVAVIVARAMPSCGSGAARPCPAADLPHGVRSFALTGEGARCASACPIMLAGAVRRMTAPGARLGVHSSRFDEDTALGRAVTSMGVTQEELRQNTEEDLVGLFEELGVDPELARRSSRTPHRSMDWLSPEEVRAYRLINADLDRSDRLAQALGPSASPPAGPAAGRTSDKPSGKPRR